jgi:hypothetical protein
MLRGLALRGDCNLLLRQTAKSDLVLNLADHLDRQNNFSDEALVHILPNRFIGCSARVGRQSAYCSDPGRRPLPLGVPEMKGDENGRGGRPSSDLTGCGPGRTISSRPSKPCSPLR